MNWDMDDPGMSKASEFPLSKLRNGAVTASYSVADWCLLFSQVAISYSSWLATGRI